MSDEVILMTMMIVEAITFFNTAIDLGAEGSELAIASGDKFAPSRGSWEGVRVSTLATSASIGFGFVALGGVGGF